MRKLTIGVLLFMFSVANAQYQDTETAPDLAEDNEYYQSGLEYGFRDCQNTCAESNAPDQVEQQNESQVPRRRKRQTDLGCAQEEEETVEQEVVTVPNSEAWLYWQGYAEGYSCCTYGCKQFYPEEEELPVDQGNVITIRK